MSFRISQKADVLVQLRVLRDRAKKTGTDSRFIRATKQVLQHLESHPTEWGDPEYHLKHEGGVVYRGIEDRLLIVRFAVYAIEKSVYVLEVKPFPRSPLAQEQ